MAAIERNKSGFQYRNQDFEKFSVENFLYAQTFIKDSLQSQGPDLNWGYSRSAGDRVAAPPPWQVAYYYSHFEK